MLNSISSKRAFILHVLLSSDIIDMSVKESRSQTQCEKKKKDWSVITCVQVGVIV